MATIEQIIEETPLIREAINSNQIPSLYDALMGMLNLRNELIQSVPPDELSKTNELVILDELIGRVAIYLAEWHGIGDIAGKLFLRGAIRSRGELLRIAAPIYDQMDWERAPSKNVPLIGVVGQIASGKGTVGDLLRKTYHSMHLPLSDRLREVATMQGSLPPHERESLRQVNDSLKPRFGNPVFVRWTMDMSQRLASVYEDNMISIDGFRSLDEAQLFKSMGGLLIAVTASPDTRFQRLLERKRGADDFNRNSFNKSDQIESAWINPIIDIADIVIPNEGSVKELETQILDFMEKKTSIPSRKNILP